MTRRERARLIRALTWPVALLVVGSVMIGVAQGLARLDGFRLYGLVQAMGEIVGMIGLAWLNAVLIGALAARVRRP
jgi:hypothetical protein